MPLQIHHARQHVRVAVILKNSSFPLPSSGCVNKHNATFHRSSHLLLPSVHKVVGLREHKNRYGNYKKQNIETQERVRK
jgi:hypothetical protein